MIRKLLAAAAVSAGAVALAALAAVPSGYADVTGYEIVWQRSADISAGQVADAVALCPTGKRALGGGFGAGGPSVVIRVFSSVPTEPSLNRNGWQITAKNEDASTRYFDVFAVCGTVS